MENIARAPSPNAVSFQFVTRLNGLPASRTTVHTDGRPADKIKKEARASISLKHASNTLGFLHALLLRIGKEHFLLAGPAGVGKSTYAQLLSTKAEVSVLANDWVAVERGGNYYYASDLNFADSIRHEERCKLSGIIFLTFNDELQRDAYVPNRQELTQLLNETFDTVPEASAQKLHAFWLENATKLPLCAALPARRGAEATVADTLFDVLGHSVWPRETEVGVIGTGAVGTELAFQLGQLPFVKKVHLFNRSVDKAVGLALDMNQALIARSKQGVTFVAHHDAKELFSICSSIFLTFRGESADARLYDSLPERWQKLLAHLPIAAQYAGMAREAQFRGALFMVTNPVDVLTYALYAGSKLHTDTLKTYQVYGVGLELDAMRARSYVHALGIAVEPADIALYGNHADDFVLSAPIPPEQQEALLAAVRGASQSIRKYVPRTIYGPVMAAITSFEAYFTGRTQTHLTLLQEGAFIGRSVSFRHGLPLLPEDDNRTLYAALLDTNRKSIAQFLPKL